MNVMKVHKRGARVHDIRVYECFVIAEGNICYAVTMNMYKASSNLPINTSPHLSSNASLPIFMQNTRRNLELHFERVTDLSASLCSSGSKKLARYMLSTVQHMSA
jgi:hypothetical protein